MFDSILLIYLAGRSKYNRPYPRSDRKYLEGIDFVPLNVSKGHFEIVFEHVYLILRKISKKCLQK